MSYRNGNNNGKSGKRKNYPTGLRDAAFPLLTFDNEIHQNFLIKGYERKFLNRKLKIKMDGTRFFNAKNWSTISSFVKNLFSKIVDALGVYYDNVDQFYVTAKYAIVIEDKFPKVGVDSIDTVLCNKLTNATSELVEKASLLYLMHLIMSVENANKDRSSRKNRVLPFCKEFERSLSNNKTEIFRNIVCETVSFVQRKQLYCLRQKWGLFFSQETLQGFDRDDIWKRTTGESTSSSPYKRILINGPSSSRPTLDNTLKTFKETFSECLCDDWIVEFPLSESDKKRFTEKYSVKKPLEKEHVVSLYNKKIEFSPNKIKEAIVMLDPSAAKDKYIEIAKEAFFVENIFGKNKTLAIAEIMETRLDMRNSKTTRAFLEHLKTLLLVHIIVYAEATRSSYKKVPKIGRPFMTAFATEIFFLKFRTIVASTHVNPEFKQMLYWMRIRWNTCFEDDFISKIEENKIWGKNGIEEKELPEYFKNKNKEVVFDAEKESGDEVSIVAQIDKRKNPDEVAVVLLEFSEDEEEDNEVIRVQNKKCYEAEENYINIFMANRRNEWTKYFFMEPNCIEKLRQKFSLPKEPGINAEGKTITALDFAETLFQDTFSEVFPTPNEPALMNLAKEAFFLITEFGYGVVETIVKYLLPIMQKGGRYSKSRQTKLVAQLIAFLTLHIITAIESVEPMIVPEISERAYIKSIEDNNGFSIVKSFIRTIEEEKLKSSLKFLTLTWTINDESRVSERTNVKYKRNQNNEIFLIRDIISNINGMYYQATCDKEKLVNKKSCYEKLKETEKEKNTKALSAKTANDLQNLFVPDKISTPIIPSVPKRRRIISEELSDEDESRRRSVPGNNRTSSSSTTGLLGVNEQPIHTPRSKREKAMEDLKKLLEERNGRKKKGRPVTNERPVPRPVPQVQMIDNFDSDEFVNNLLTSSSFEIGYDGGAKVTFNRKT